MAASAFARVPAVYCGGGKYQHRCSTKAGVKCCFVLLLYLNHFAAGMMPLILAEILAFSTTNGGQRHSLTTNANVANEDPRGGQPELQPDVCLHLVLCTMNFSSLWSSLSFCFVFLFFY